VLTLFFIAATAFLVARRRYPLLPLLFVVWANLDGGVMLGFVILVGGTVAEFLEDREWPVPIAVAIVGCFAATMITPLGVSIWTDIPASLARLRAYGVTEWRPPNYADPMLLPFSLLAVYLLWLVVRDRPWRSASVRSDSNLWAALAMLPFAVNSGRHVPAFLLLAVPAIAAIRPTSRVAFSRKPSARKAPRLERPVLNTGIFAAAAVLAGFTVTYAWVSQTARLGWHPLSQRAIVALRSCPGPLYNRYDDGGYVIWFVPDRKVFLDSRQDPYPPALVNDQIRVEASGNYQQLFRRFAIRCVLAPPESVISQRLVADGWQHAYRGKTFVVLYSSGVLQAPRKFGFKIGNEL
jgi:NADH:ubiquinone oxidoreductase subunit 6 (subunit J)